MIRFSIHGPTVFGPVADVLATLCRRALPHIESFPSIAAYDIPDKDIEVRIVLGGDAEMREWKVRSDGLGVHCVCVSKTDEETDENYYEVCEHNQVIVSLDAGVRHLAEAFWASKPDRLDREAELEAWLVTLPHEMIHVLEWIKETAGRTPDQMFDEDCEFAIIRAQRAITRRLGGADQEERFVEDEARRVVDAVGRVLVQEAADALDAHFGWEVAPVP